jgi:hypothetical protein
MPTRTIVQDFCDACFDEQGGKEVPATDRLRFGWQGRDFLLLVCDRHVEPIRNELQRLAELATPDPGSRRAASVAPRATAPTHSGPKTLFSELTNEEKERFRIWAEMPTARRIADARVAAWTAAGKP